MKIVGLITEYNPFHNGHQYHIEMAKKMTGADAVIVIMSGNFVQRGVPAIMPKQLRTEAALHAGASLVIELPIYYATASAESFALGAVSLLDRLDCVDYLCFGSECGDISILDRLAVILSEEPHAYQTMLQHYLKCGDAFPLARQKALKQYLLQEPCFDNACFHTGLLDEILESPNNILGIEYLKALHNLHSRIVPVTIQRIASAYHDTELTATYSSASAIRHLLEQPQTPLPAALFSQMPPNSYALLQQAYQTRFPVCANDFSLLLKYRLLKESKESLGAYMDVSKDLANRIIKLRNQFVHIEQFCNLLKTKELTYTRISRALLHILLEMKTEDYNNIIKNGLHGYVQVLGFQKEQASLLTAIKKQATIPILTKRTDDKISQLPAFAQMMLQTERNSSNLYESVITDKFHTPYKDERTQSIVRI